MVTELAVGTVAALSLILQSTGWEALVLMLILPPLATGGYVAFEESRQRKRERPGPTYAGWLHGDLREVTVDDLLSSSSSDSDFVTLPHASENGYLFVAIPESISGQVAGIRLGNGILMQPWPRQRSTPTVDRIQYSVLVSEIAYSHIVSEEEILIWRYGDKSKGLPVV